MADSDNKTPKGDGYGPGAQDDNIVVLPTLAEREMLRQQKEAAARAAHPAPPIINLPFLTKMMMGAFLAVHVVINYALPQAAQEWIYVHIGFVPGRFTGTLPFEPLALITPLTHIFIHGSWLHLAMNTVMMAAFGSGIERWMGARRMALFFFLCGLCGAAFHFALNMHSPYPVIGASGALSGLFAAAIIMLNRGRGEMGGRFGILPFIILWIGITVGFGMMGSPDGHDIAWAAHLGGFLGGFVILKLMKV